jgi:Fur family iron response transcriptional regulator
VSNDTLKNYIPHGCTTSEAMRGWKPDAQARDIGDLLRKAGLRPTQQRMSLARLLFLKGNRHVSAETLHEEAIRARMPVSLATVYNTLNQFHQSGLLREVAVDGTRTYFDTNISDHHHFYFEGENKVIDIPSEGIVLQNLPEAPEGMEIARIDIVVRLKRKMTSINDSKSADTPAKQSIAITTKNKY